MALTPNTIFSVIFHIGFKWVSTNEGMIDGPIFRGHMIILSLE